MKPDASEPLWPQRRARVAQGLLGLGQISLDRVGVVARWLRRGEKQVLEQELLLPGGQIATAVLAAVQQGLPGALVAAVGDDDAAEQALAPLRGAGVDVSDVRRFPGVPTRQAWLVCERDSAERTILERRDPALRLRAEDVPAARVESAAALLVDAEHPEASLRAVALARRAGAPTLCDVERADPTSWAILREVDFPIVSQGFADECWSGSSAEAALARLVGPATRMAVLTRGAQGALARWGDCVLEVPALQIEALDTTGAGDVFRGSFAVALLAGRGAREVLEWANAAAGLSCLGRGAQGALPCAADVEARLRRVG